LTRKNVGRKGRVETGWEGKKERGRRAFRGREGSRNRKYVLGGKKKGFNKLRPGYPFRKRGGKRVGARKEKDAEKSRGRPHRGQEKKNS